MCDPLLHDPARLPVVAVLAALPAGDALSIARLRQLVRLTPVSLTKCVSELERAGYVRSTTASVALTHDGRVALDRYTTALRERALARHPAPVVRVGDADRDAAAAALGEHFAQGRLNLDELNERLAAILTATTYGELSRTASDLPVIPAPRTRRTRP